MRVNFRFPANMGGIQAASDDAWEKTGTGWQLRSGGRAITYFFDALTYPKEGVARAAILLPLKAIMVEAEIALPPDVVLEEVISQEIRQMAFSADSRLLFTDNRVNGAISVASTINGVWLTNFWSPKARGFGADSIAASPDGRHLAVGNWSGGSRAICV